ncbi:SCP2 sterol-binding domain-containing protein [Aromatoleum evansii]|uniref:Ubiquinone biosynthesis accessory factor UbiJ n=1 Tax=Aromatoleum evansii TaxID=59406 RepID=A0ABZ1AL27_AROEV|nr:SCP2 sterol-binding domain-containing protein [Aromatoleum evansii]
MSVLDFGTRGALAAINHLLARANWARERLAPHAGRCARLSADPVALAFGIDTDGYLVDAADGRAPDVTLSLPFSALPGLAGGDANKLMNAVRIEGSAELADALGFVFRNLRWDAEEDLSRVFGDIVAHRMVEGAASLRRMHERAWAGLTGNLAEYLAEEQQALVTRAALASFGDELRILRDDLARLDKRLGRLYPPPTRA